MSYNVTLLTTQAECDSLLTIAAKEKSDLEFRTTTLSRQKLSYTQTSTTVDQGLVSVNAEVAALQTVVQTLPDGRSKDEQLKKLKRAELRQFLLTQKDKDYSSVSLLVLDMDINRTQKELDEVNVFINALQERKNGL